MRKRVRERAASVPEAAGKAPSPEKRTAERPLTGLSAGKLSGSIRGQMSDEG